MRHDKQRIDFNFAQRLATCKHRFSERGNCLGGSGDICLGRAAITIEQGKALQTSQHRFGSGGIEQGSRPLPEEVAVALSFNGSTQAVMMATPADLVDFAYGFSLTEGIATPDEIASVDVVEAAQGSLSVHSEPGLGAVFMIDLPLTATAPVRPAATAQSQWL